jgi:polyhydroxyalkanoate synthesis regulator phasin
MTAALQEEARGGAAAQADVAALRAEVARLREQVSHNGL